MWHIKNIQIVFIGKTQTYSSANDGYFFGRTFKILQNDTSEENNAKTCFGTKGTNKVPTMPQVVIPDLRNFSVVIKLN